MAQTSPGGPGGLKGRLVRLDAYQQGHPWLAFPIAVVKKFGDDKAGRLGALIAYYGFFSLFPLLLVFVTVLTWVLTDAELRQDVVDSVLAYFPIVGDQIRNNVDTLHGSGLVLAVGLVGALWGGMAVMQAAQDAMNAVWEVPIRERPNFLKSRLRSLTMLVVLGVGIVVSTLITGAAAGGAGDSLLLQGVAIAIGLLVNFGLFLAAYRVLTVRDVSMGDLVPGAALAAVATLILQSLGGYLISHQLRSAGETYKDLAFVIVLLSWMSLQAQVTLFGAEINVVRARRVWPRSLLQDPLVDADIQVLTEVAKVEEKLPQQEVDVNFASDGVRNPETGAEAPSGTPGSSAR